MFMFIEKNGLRAIDGEFLWAGSFRDGVACVKETNGLFVIIDKKGRLVCKLPQFQKEATCVLEGMVRVCDEGKYGYANLSGDICIEPQFRYAEDFSEGVAVVRVRGGRNFVSPSGRICLGENVQELCSFSSGLALCKQASKWCYIGHDWKVALGPYDHACSFTEGVAQVKVGGDYYYIDKSGAVLFQSDDSTSDYCIDGCINFHRAGKTGCYDIRGRVIIEAIYDSVGSFSEGYSCVKKDGRLFIINKSGGIVAAQDCDEVDCFSEGVAAFRRNGKYGYMNRGGEVVIDALYDVAAEFSEEVAVVAID
jgi:hypothetical protein